MKRALLGLLVLMACSKERVSPQKPKDAAPPETSADIQAKWDEMVPKEENPRALPKSWTEPKVIAALTRNCDYKPQFPISAESNWAMIGYIGSNRYECHYDRGFTQSDAAVDLCSPYDRPCQDKCKDTCVSCDQTCADACKSCMQPCGASETDAGACKWSCAKTCAECKETCTKTWDACNDGACTERDACRARLSATYQKNNCAKRCATYNACAAKCSGESDGACLEKCSAVTAPGYEACAEKCWKLEGPERELCHLKCYETVPCGPDLCKHPPP